MLIIIFFMYRTAAQSTATDRENPLYESQVRPIGLDIMSLSLREKNRGSHCHYDWPCTRYSLDGDS